MAGDLCVNHGSVQITGTLADSWPDPTTRGVMIGIAGMTL